MICRKIFLRALPTLLLTVLTYYSAQASNSTSSERGGREKAKSINQEEETSIVQEEFLVSISGQQGKEKSIEELRQEADRLLRLPNVDVRAQVNIVFETAQRLTEIGKNKEALKYYLEGLEVMPWSLENQLACAKLLLLKGDEQLGKEKLELVAEYAEDGRLVVKALESLGRDIRKMCEEIQPLHKIAGDDYVLVLIPMGEVDGLLLREVAEDLQNELGISVILQKAEVDFPVHHRDARESYIKNLRSWSYQIIETPIGKSALAMCNTTADELKDDRQLIRVCKQIISLQSGKDKARDFLERLESLSERNQWDADELQEALQAAVKLYRTEKVGYLGITQKDIFAKDYNFLFGWAWQRLGVMSYHRFRADFNQETPNRQRLRKRTLKQCLSSASHIFGIPRCTNPLCARAYPNDLKEHDAKGDHLCSICKRSLQEKFGEK